MSSELNVIREPELYDLFNGRCREDIPMYISLFSQAATVLELGIGTGRIALPLAENGINVVGLDNSQEMLDYLQDKITHHYVNISDKIKAINQDFCYLDLSDSFDFVFYPFCTFNYLLSLQQQEQALTSLKKHLNVNAQVVFDLMTIHTFSNMLYDTHHAHYDSYTSDDIDISMATQSSFDQSRQIFSQERIFKYYRHNDKILEKRVKMVNRIFFYGEFKLLLAKCGYKILKEYGSYSFLEFNPSSRCLVVIATPV